VIRINSRSSSLDLESLRLGRSLQRPHRRGDDQHS